MNIFIIPSCIKSKLGMINHDERFEQTLKTFETVRKQVPNSIIVFCDSSIGGLEDQKRFKLRDNVDFYLDYSGDETAQEINEKKLKSHGETYLLQKAIDFAKTKIDLEKETGRMFKLGGRCELLDEFTMDDYADADGKFVFKKRTESWMEKTVQLRNNSTHTLQTRLYSWSLSMTDEYLSILEKNVPLLNSGLDTEHAHFVNIPKDKLLEFDVLNVGCYVAGYTESYYIKD